MTAQASENVFLKKYAILHVFNVHNLLDVHVQLTLNILMSIMAFVYANQDILNHNKIPYNVLLTLLVILHVVLVQQANVVVLVTQN